jgi:hypothetical protein
MVFCSSREIISLKKLVGPAVSYSGSNEPCLAPEFKWPDNAFKMQKQRVTDRVKIKIFKKSFLVSKIFI